MSTGSVIFQRDMVLNIPLIAELHAIRQHRQALIDERLFRANRSPISHDYQPNEQVLILVYKPDKLQP